MSFDVRRYHPSDLPTLYRICLDTAVDGDTAIDHHGDPELPGHQYLGAYLAFEPRLAFVLTKDAAPVGYIVGAADTASFAARCESDWYPVLRERYPMPADADRSHDAELVRALHAGIGRWPAERDHPAHLHVDLLPAGRGGGFGRALMERFVAELRRLDVPGVHLGVAASNHNAIAFYERVGFSEVDRDESTIVHAQRLTRPT